MKKINLFDNRINFLLPILFLFIQSTFTFSQHPNCGLYGAVYRLGSSQINCANAHVNEPGTYDYDASCEDLVLEVELQYASAELTEDVDVQIKIPKSTLYPYQFLNLDVFTDNSTTTDYIFDATVTLDENNPEVTLYITFRSTKGGFSTHYLVPRDKLHSQSNFYTYPTLKFDNYTGNIISGTLQQAITDGYVTSASNSCSSGPQLISIHDVLNIDVASYCFHGGWNNQSNQTGNHITHLTMSPGAEIIVEAGNTLILRNELVTCCLNQSDRWKSITVESGATLIALNTTFDNGHYAINAMPGSTIYVKDCHFEDAYVGIYGGPTNDGVGPSVIYANGNTSFTFDGTFNSSYSGEEALDGGKTLAGLKVEDCNNVFVSYNGGSSPSFDNLQYGILLRNSNLYAHKPKFSNLTSGISQFGIWGGGVGIASRSDHQNNFLDVTGFGKNSTVNFNNITFGVVNRGNLLTFKDNKMTDMYSCIDHKDTRQNASIISNFMQTFHIGIDLALNSGPGGEIHENDIYVKTYDDAIGITQLMERKEWDIKQNLIESHKGQFGLLRNSSRFGFIHENTFQMKSTVSDYYSGVKNENGGSVNFYCNYFPSESSSTEAYGMLSSMSPTLYLTCNEFDNYRFSTGFVNGNLNTKGYIVYERIFRTCPWKPNQPDGNHW